MPGQVQHLEGPVAEVDHVALADLADLRARPLMKRFRRDPWRQRGDKQRLAHGIPGPFEHGHLRLPPRLQGAERSQRRAAQQPRLKAVRPDIAKLMMTTNVVVVPVRGTATTGLSIRSASSPATLASP